MRILTVYILRRHVGPFLFSIAALTLLLLLDQVAKKLEMLVGKDLGGAVIAEVFLYSIPFLVAVMIPMAVLVAVLFVFNQLAADNEISAMKASGIGLHRLMAPVLITSGLVAGGLMWFNDRVLPESNHQLAVLMADIGRKKPTFALSEQTINELSRGRLFLRVARINSVTNLMQDITIFDERERGRSRTIYADSGRMALTDTDLHLTLYDGVMTELELAEDETFGRVAFAISYMRIQNVANELQRDSVADFRGDRELPIHEMRERAQSNRSEAELVGATSRGLAVGLARRLIGAEPDSATASAATDQVARADGIAQADSTGAAAPDTARSFANGLRMGLDLNRPSAAVNAFRVQATRYRTNTEAASRYDVEIQKKLSIPAACIVFVLIGAPIGSRYRRGGVGLVIGVSLAVFSLYYVSLIGGEELADRRFLSPFWAMWAPNVLFGTIGVLALFRQRRAVG
ncbi:MAG: LptF/LptG family permease [Gemmatimonadota bacterium]